MPVLNKCLLKNRIAIFVLRIYDTFMICKFYLDIPNQNCILPKIYEKIYFKTLISKMKSSYLFLI